MTLTKEDNSVIIPDKRGYVEKEFVGRDQERAVVAERVSQAKRKEKIGPPILNFWGIEGSGKSWLLRHLAGCYRGPGELGEGECRRTFTAILDFKEFERFEWTSRDVAILLKPAIEDISQQLPEPEIEAFSELLADVEAAKDGEMTADKLAQAFANRIVSLTEEFVPLILLDTIERVPPGALTELELYLIEPLVRTDRVILITAGRHEVARWRRFAVRSRQSEPIQLKSLSPEDTADQVDKQGFGLPGELVYDFSFGLAYASQVMAAAIRDVSNGHTVDESFLSENAHRLEPWLAALEKHLLQDASAVSPKLADDLRALCVLRAIHEGALPFLLPEMKGNDEAYRTLLDELEATPLLWWDSRQGTYQMPESLRRLLCLRMWLKETELFERRHRQAAEYYLEIVKKNPYDSGLYVLEALYHMAYGYGGDQAAEKAQAFLTEVLKPDNFTVGGVELLLEQIQKDEELRLALPGPVLDQVTETVQAFDRDVRRMRLSLS